MAHLHVGGWRRTDEHAVDGPRRCPPADMPASKPRLRVGDPGSIEISDPSDPFEREAAANAERVMSAPAPEHSAPPTPTPAAAVQRDAAVEEQEEEPAG